MDNMAKRKKRPQMTACNICIECAEKNKGTWPKGHVATANTRVCNWCGVKKCVMHLSDWNWPEGSTFKPFEKAREV
jgi:hypothetical protein